MPNEPVGGSPNRFGWEMSAPGTSTDPPGSAVPNNDPAPEAAPVAVPPKGPLVAPPVVAPPVASEVEPELAPPASVAVAPSVVAPSPKAKADAADPVAASGTEGNNTTLANAPPA